MAGSNLLLFVFEILLLGGEVFQRAHGLGEIIYAINAGGGAHVDNYGIRYQADKLQEGISSDFGMRIDIRRALPRDQALYQTERYGMRNFGYDIPIKADGDYVLVMKFCEVYFRAPYQKVFNVVLNSQHLILSDFDIFQQVGYATAHDEYFEFKVKNNKRTLVIGGEESDITDGTIKLKFVKGAADNPKINAFYVMKGKIQDVPKLMPLEEEIEDAPLFEDEEDEEVIYNSQDFSQDFNLFSTGVGKKVKSGPSVHDPWDDEPHSVIYAPVIGSAVISIIALIFVRSVMKS